MISYELAKELQKAGFLFDLNSNMPTLSELIEACGWKFNSLHKKKKGWKAYYNGGVKKGKTPEEAVAKLWLELNKNNA